MRCHLLSAVPLTALLLLANPAPSLGAGGYDLDTPETVTSTFGSAHSLHVVDLDRDGDLDVFVAAQILDEGFGYFENLGNGTWAPAVDLVPSDGDSWEDSWDVLTADLDSDGDPDLLTSGETVDGASLLWWENDGAPASWTSRAVRSQGIVARLEALQVLDLDADGDLDVLAMEGSEILWFENDLGGGTLTDWTEHSIGIGPEAYRIEIADLDRDGDLDLVTPDNSGDRVTWWENLAGDFSTWWERTIDGSFQSARSVAVGDLDGDGDLDVAATSSADDLVSWWVNDGSGGGWTERSVATAVDGARDLRAADLDRDGDLDLVVTIAFDDVVAWWENLDGAGSSWQQHDLPGTLDQPERLEVLDLDRDGRQDVLASVWFDDSVLLWPGQSPDRTPEEWTRLEIDAQIDHVHDLRLEDLDRDGDLDLVGAGAFGTRGVRWWEQTATGWEDPITLDAGLLANFHVASGDIDRDGDPDLLILESLNDSFSWRENRLEDGLSWTKHAIDTHADSTSIAVLDVDGTGTLDVVVSTDGGGGGLHWWSNDAGDGSTWTENDLDFGETSTAHRVGDWDGDGDPDLVGLSQGGINRLSVWENPLRGPSTSWFERNLTDVSVAGNGVTAWADLDRDGQGDAVLVDDDGTILVWLSNASGGARTFHLVDEDSLGVVAVTAADLDGDGDDDLAVASSTAGTVTWWRNDGDGVVWAPIVVASGLSAPSALVAADVDRDGAPDLVVSDGGAEELFWLRAEPFASIFSDGFESGSTAAWGP